MIMIWSACDQPSIAWKIVLTSTQNGPQQQMDNDEIFVRILCVMLEVHLYQNFYYLMELHLSTNSRKVPLEELLERYCCIWCYHVYKEVWEASFGEPLTYEREPDNASDRYTIIAMIGMSIPNVKIVMKRVKFCWISNRNTIVPSVHVHG